jgi:predicted nucleic-acid-binding Zn-ribbon protein
MKTSAKYYIYRNLRTGGFSVRYRGKVIDRLHKFTAMSVEFRVNAAGRQRVLSDRQKNVHAFVVADKYKGLINSGYVLDKLAKVKYNPYIDAQFKCGYTEIYNAKEVVFSDGQCFVAVK